MSKLCSMQAPWSQFNLQLENIAFLSSEKGAEKDIADMNMEMNNTVISRAKE